MDRGGNSGWVFIEDEAAHDRWMKEWDEYDEAIAEAEPEENALDAADDAGVFTRPG